MARARMMTAVAAATSCLMLSSAARAQLDDHIWIGGTGNQLWQVDSNWDLGMFPNDPGRMDPDMTVVSNVEGANLSVDLASGLNVDVGATDVTIAALTVGSTSGAVATDVTSSGGMLVFENFELNDGTDPDNVVCAFNCGAALITSQGVAGSTNTISAVVGINDQVQVTGTRDITLAGGMAEISPGVSLSALSPTATVLVTGNITTVDSTTTPEEEDTPLSLNLSGTSQGTIDISGVITGAGRMRFGTGVSQPVFPLGTVILRGNNSYSGRTIMSRGNVVLAHDNALGTADVKHQGPQGNLETGYNFLSDNDNRTIANNLILGEWQSIKGDHSLEWSGIVYQDNARGWINLLPAGKTLTLSGGQFPNHTEEMPPAEGRILTFDGSGRTLITGGLHDEWSTETETINPGNYVGRFRFRGTGATVVSGGNSTYTGATLVQGGNLHFATNSDFGFTSQFDSTGGAVGVDAGVVNNFTFLALLNNASSPANDIAGNPVVYDHGALMLGTGEYGMNLDFTGTLASAADMSLAAHESGNSYTGTITPANNTYRLGGGSGTLTLPNAQLNGANNDLVVTNGGEVVLSGSNNYGGTTSVVAKYVETLEALAAADAAPNDDIDDDIIQNDQQYVGTILTVTSLANGGSPSSIGSASSDASNLYIQGSTLKYTGGAASTDRLFTIGTGGATIDASGTGAINFGNSGSLGVDVAEQRTGNVNAFATGNTVNDQLTIRNLPSTEDLQPGMPIMSPDLSPSVGIPADTVITRIASRSDVQISNATGLAFSNNTTITFGPAPERTLTLTGSNSGENTLAAVIPDASDGGVVGVTKSGDGKWILTGNSMYTGDTTVSDGTLSITNPYLANESDVRMLTGGIFDLNFTGTDIIDELFFDGIAQAMGTWGAIGNALATNHSAFFTGTGLLQVSTSTVIPVPGDYNQNGIVDAADYVTWRKAQSAGAMDLPNRDTGLMGAVGNDDYVFWRERFGNTSGAAVGTAAIPEPMTGLLMAFGWIVLASGRRSRRVR